MTRQPANSLLSSTAVVGVATLMLDGTAVAEDAPTIIPPQFYRLTEDGRVILQALDGRSVTLAEGQFVILQDGLLLVTDEVAQNTLDSLPIIGSFRASEFEFLEPVISSSGSIVETDQNQPVWSGERQPIQTIDLRTYEFAQDLSAETTEAASDLLHSGLGVGAAVSLSAILAALFGLLSNGEEDEETSTLEVTNPNEDTSPPELASYTLSNYSIDLSNGEVSIDVSARITDDVSGVFDGENPDGSASSASQVRWESPSGNQIVEGGYFAAPLNSNSLDYTFSDTMTFGENAETGTWSISYFLLVDEAGNSVSLSKADLDNLGIQTTLYVGHNSPPAFTSDTTASFAENGTGTVYTTAATDADGDTPTYHLIGGADQALFDIDSSSGALTFKSAPDYEDPTDSGGDNVYEVQIEARDENGGMASQTVSITVTNANDNNPAFSSGTTASFAENGTGTVYTAAATDADGDTPTYHLIGGADQALFDIDSSSGALTFKSAPDYEDPTDSGGDNVYEVQIEARDGNGGTAIQTVSITVTDEIGLVHDYGSYYGGLTAKVVTATNSEDNLVFGYSAAYGDASNMTGDLTVNLLDGQDFLSFGDRPAHAGEITINGGSGDKNIEFGEESGLNGGNITINNDYTGNNNYLFGQAAQGLVNIYSGTGDDNYEFGGSDYPRGSQLNIYDSGGTNTYTFDGEVARGDGTTIFGVYITDGDGGSMYEFKGDVAMSYSSSVSDDGYLSINLGDDNSNDAVIFHGIVSNAVVHNWDPAIDDKIKMTGVNWSFWYTETKSNGLFDLIFQRQQFSGASEKEYFEITDQNINGNSPPPHDYYFDYL